MVQKREPFELTFLPANRTEYVDPKTSRTLTLLAKTLQNLANLVRFAQKEAYMMDVNPFIDENIDRMRNYIDGLAVSVRFLNRY